VNYDQLKFYRGKKTLVTGGAGFVGLNLVARLLEIGSEVTVYDYSIGGQAEELVRKYGGQLKLLQGDIRDEAKVADAVRGQTVLFDLAGKSGATDSNKTPLIDLDVNCRGHLTVLEACRQFAPEICVVFPSSRLVYGKPDYLPVDEGQRLKPESIYAVHKLVVEHYLQLYAKQFELKSAILRISNPYGPFQGSDARIYGIANRFVQLAVRDQTISLFGEGNQKRDYLYIDDLSDALLRAGFYAATPTIILNIGGSEVVSLRQLAEMIVRQAQTGRIEIMPWPEEYKSIETGDYVSDLQRAREVLGWAPQVSLQDGLVRTIANYRNN